MMPNQTVTCTRWDELFWRDQIRWRVTIQPELNDQEPQDTATFITGKPTLLPHGIPMKITDIYVPRSWPRAGQALRNASSG